MAGKGIRTQNLGEFKPFIKIGRKKMFSWFIASIKHSIKPKDTFLLITLHKNFIKHKFELITKKIFSYHNLDNKIEYFSVLTTPRGTSETILSAKKLIKKNERVMVIYPDQYTDFEMPHLVDKCAYLGVYVQFGNKSGFVNIQEGRVIRFVEKTNISNIASSGFYLFPSGNDLIYGINKQIDSGKSLNGEYYLGPIFNYLIQKKIKVYPVEIKSKYDLGNPKDIAYFLKNFVNKHF